MLVLLRDHFTRLYYADRGRWTPNPASAVNFSSVEEALLRNRQEHLAHTEIVVHHSLPHSTVVLPVGQQRWFDPRRTFF